MLFIIKLCIQDYNIKIVISWNSLLSRITDGMTVNSPGMCSEYLHK